MVKKPILVTIVRVRISLQIIDCRTHLNERIFYRVQIGPDLKSEFQTKSS